MIFGVDLGTKGGDVSCIVYYRYINGDYYILKIEHEGDLKMTEISDERLAELEDKEARLDALDAGGVDNWEWYGDSLEEYFKNKFRS